MDIAMFEASMSAAVVAGHVLTAAIWESNLIIPTDVDVAFAGNASILKGTMCATLAASVPKDLGVSTFKCEIQDGFTRNAESDTYTLAATTIFENFSQLTLTTSKLLYKSIDRASVEIGAATMESLKLVLGNNSLVTVITLPNESVYQKLMTTGNTYTISGYDGMGTAAYRTQIYIPKHTPGV